MAKIDIGKEFSEDPAGRFYRDKMPSGEEFREEYLWPALKRLSPGEHLTVILDSNVDGYGSSFLVEGFAGVVKYGYMRSDDLDNCLDFQYSDPDFKFFADKIRQYIRSARFNSEKYVSTKE